MQHVRNFKSLISSILIIALLLPMTPFVYAEEEQYLSSMEISGDYQNAKCYSDIIWSSNYDANITLQKVMVDGEEVDKSSDIRTGDNSELYLEVYSNEYAVTSNTAFIVNGKSAGNLGDIYSEELMLSGALVLCSLESAVSEEPFYSDFETSDEIAEEEEVQEEISNISDGADASSAKGPINMDEDEEDTEGFKSQDFTVDDEGVYHFSSMDGLKQIVALETDIKKAKYDGSDTFAVTEPINTYYISCLEINNLLIPEGVSVTTGIVVATNITVLGDLTIGYSNYNAEQSKISGSLNVEGTFTACSQIMLSQTTTIQGKDKISYRDEWDGFVVQYLINTTEEFYSAISTANTNRAPHYSYQLEVVGNVTVSSDITVNDDVLIDGSLTVEDGCTLTITQGDNPYNPYIYVQKSGRLIILGCLNNETEICIARMEESDAPLLSVSDTGSITYGSKGKMVIVDSQKNPEQLISGVDFSKFIRTFESQWQYQKVWDEINVTSISAENVSHYEGEGFLSEGFNDEGNLVSYYTYEIFPKTITVIIDGNQEPYTGSAWDVWSRIAADYGLDDEGGNFNFTSDQSVSNQWGIGSHDCTFRFLNKTCTYQTVIEPSPILSITIPSVSMYLNDTYQDTWHDNYGNTVYYQRYNWRDLIYDLDNVEVIAKARPDQPYTGYLYECLRQLANDLEIDTNVHSIDFSYNDDQSPSNLWGKGTHHGTLTALGYQADVSVDIIDSPIISLSVVSPQAFFEGDTRTRYDWGQNDSGGYGEIEYPFYPVDDVSKIVAEVVTSKGAHTGYLASIIEELCSELEISQDYIYRRMIFEHDQSSTNIWGKGRHYVTLKLLGASANYAVDIIDNPIESMSISPVTVVEGNTQKTSTWEPDENGNQTQIIYDYYNYYSLAYENSILEITVNGKPYNGNFSTVLQELSDDLGLSTYYIENSIKTEDDQSYTNLWTVGEHHATVTLLGFTTDLVVNIEASPVVSFTVQPMRLIKGDTYNTYSYDENGSYTVRGEYDIRPVSCVLKTNSGKQYAGDYWSVLESIREDYGNIDGKTWISEGDPSYLWEAGDHTVFCSILGATAQYTVTVIEDPIQSITVDQCVLWEGENKTVNYYYDMEAHQDVPISCYSVEPKHYDVTMKNGEELEFASRYEIAEYIKGNYSISNINNCSVDTNETPTSLWGPGEHEATLSIGGYRGSVPVLIKSDPIQSITVDPVTLTTSDRGTASYMDENGEEHEYPYYSIWPSMIRVQPVNGDVIEGSINDILEWLNNDIGMTNIDWWVDTDQNYDNVWEAGDHQATLRLGERRIPFTVHIIEGVVLDSWSWADDGSAAWAHLRDTDEEDIYVTVDAEVSVLNFFNPTCENSGYTEKEAEVLYKGKWYSDIKTFELPPTGHAYGELYYDWVETDDGYDVIASVTCQNDPSHVVTERVTAECSIVNEPTCEEEGYATYYAEFENELFPSQSAGYSLPALGHDYSQPVWTWEDDKSGATAVFTCRNCGRSESVYGAAQTELVMETDDAPRRMVYTVSVEFNNQTYTDQIAIPYTQYKVLVSATPVGNASGQGNYYAGDNVTIAVSPIDKYDFVGWYLGSEYITSEYSYSFVVGEEDVEYLAVFTAKEGAKGMLYIYGDSFTTTVIDTEQERDFRGEVDFGTKVKVKYTGPATSFLCWENETHRIVSTDLEYEFTFSGNLTLIATTTGVSASKCRVLFVSAYDQILSAGTYTASSRVIAIPANPSRSGYAFTGWQISGQGQVYTRETIADGIRAYIEGHLGESFYVKPAFERLSSNYTVTVKYEGVEREDKVLPQNQIRKIDMTADSIPGYTFSCWKWKGEIISTEAVAAIYGFEDVELTAVYVPDGTAPEAKIPTLYLWFVEGQAKNDAGKYPTVYHVGHDVPEGFSMVEYGVVFTDNVLYANYNDLKIESSLVGQGVTVGRTSKYARVIYSASFKMSTTNETRYVRGFLTYRDDSGNLVTMYTDIRAISYETADITA